MFECKPGCIRIARKCWLSISLWKDSIKDRKETEKKSCNGKHRWHSHITPWILSPLSLDFLWQTFTLYKCLFISGLFIHSFLWSSFSFYIFEKKFSLLFYVFDLLHFKFLFNLRYFYMQDLLRWIHVLYYFIYQSVFHQQMCFSQYSLDCLFS